MEFGSSRQATTVTWGFLAILLQPACCGVTVGCGHDGDLMTFALVSANTAQPTSTGLLHRESRLGAAGYGLDDARERAHIDHSVSDQAAESATT